MSKTVLAMVVLCALAAPGRAADWPTYRGDAGRSGFTPEQPPEHLALCWTYTPAHPPAPAWPHDPRLSADRAYHVVADSQRVYFGSSADGKIYALDASTGRECWSFFTAGPVRYAPALWKDRLFAVSDDGYLYCLSSKDGQLVWKKPPVPSSRLVLGNGRMISKWPARGGPVVVDDIVYFGAGIWPTEGIRICALKADTGQAVWVNDNSGSIKMAQPHSGAVANSGISCQGYLAAAGSRLFVPTGRAAPAIFDRTDGRLLHFSHGYLWGDEAVVAIDSLMVNSGRVFDLASAVDTDKSCLSGVSAYHSQLAASDEFIFALGYQALVAVDRRQPLAPVPGSKSGTRKWNARWSAPCNHKEVAALIAAGQTVFIARSQSVAALDAMTKKELWNAPVAGTPLGLAFAAGRLYVSTEQGPIHCFSDHKGPATVVERGKPDDAATAADDFAAVAEQIVKQTGVTAGYCLDLGCGEGRLALELARRTSLRIYGIEQDPAKVARARRAIDAAGLYGVRVTILQADPADSGLPNYFADLVVSAESVADGSGPGKGALRCQRPSGGVACFGKPGAMATAVRGPLDGAGNWTHQYADAANSGCSNDALTGPLTVLWFDSPPLGAIDRHGRPPAPLVADGRFFVEGIDDVRAYDAYNGRLLWTLAVPGIAHAYKDEHLVGVAVTGGNMCLWNKTLFIRAADRCLRVDAATGRKLGEFKAPLGPDGQPGVWGLIACDDGTLLGSLADTGHIVRFKYLKADMANTFSESKELFALDAQTGRLKWRYRAERSIRHNAVALGGGVVYLIDREASAGDLFTAATTKGEEPPAHPPGMLLALDAATGQPKWKNVENTDGTMLALSTEHDALLVSHQLSRFSQRSERGDGFSVFRASTGKLLHHTQDAAFSRTRPMIVGKTVYAEPYAYDLLTGQRRAGWRLARSHGCGILAAGRNLLAFRSATLGYCNLSSTGAAENFGGVRPGCWINALPAAGLLVMPEFSDNCGCSYQVKASLALEPAGK